MSPNIDYPFTYPYEEITELPGVQRPVFTVRLGYGSKSCRVEAWLDTGADYPCFDAEFAKTLGLSLTGSQQDPIQFFGRRLQARSRNISLKFGPLAAPIHCKVFFVEGMHRWNLPNLLGRIGVLEHLQVGIDERQKQVYMALNSPVATP